MGWLTRPGCLRSTVRFRTLTVVIAICAISLIGAVGWWAYSKAESVYGTPSCSWPVRIQGSVTGGQDGLVRCYLQALARRDQAAMSALATSAPATKITNIHFRHSADARAGTATAIFSQNPVDSTAAGVVIHFADGAVENLDLINEMSMGGNDVWRIAIGSAWN
jgi:hypothetical protein